MKNLNFQVDGLEDMLDPSSGFLRHGCLHKGYMQLLRSPHVRDSIMIVKGRQADLLKKHLISLEGPESDLYDAMITWLLERVQQDTYEACPHGMAKTVWFEPMAYAFVQDNNDQPLPQQLHKWITGVKKTQGELLKIWGEADGQALCVLQVDRILVPIHRSKSPAHWSLGIISLKDRTVSHLDSAHDDEWHGAVIAELLRWTASIPFSAVPGQPWREEVVPKPPQQQNGNDCGVYVLLHAANQLSATPLDWTITAEEIFMVRQLLIAYIGLYQVSVSL